MTRSGTLPTDFQKLTEKDVGSVGSLKASCTCFSVEALSRDLSQPKFLGQRLGV